MSNLPTLVFVPGAWHKPKCYDKIIKLLEEQHHLKCIAITLPSTTGDREATFKDDIDAAREAISGETSSGRDVVVLAHSYGGMVGNSAIKGFTPQSGDDAASSGSSNGSRTGHVIGIVLIASGFTISGVAFMDPFFGHPPPMWRVNAETGFADIIIPPQKFFYHDLPADEADYWTSELAPQSLKALFEGGEHAYAGWMDVPAWYIGTIEDHGLPVVAQRLQIGAARAASSHPVVHRELPTSHSPFLSRPEETVAIIVEAVGAFTGKPVEGPSAATATTGRDNAITVVPAVRLWQPVTWYRYGLPLVFGNIIGRCVLFVGWNRRLWRSWFKSPAKAS